MTGMMGSQMTTQQRHQLIAWINALTMAVIFTTFVYFGIDFPESDSCVTKFIDFHAIWGAARIALDGDAIAAFQRETLEQAYSACKEVKMYWLYPAPMVVLISPFGTLPFLVAFLGFAVLSIIALALSMKPFLHDNKAALMLIAVAPAWLPALVIGQFTLLWCAGFMAALGAMRADRHVVAGVLIGLLTLKPTLGLLIPVILLADRRYATIAAAIITTIIVHIGALVYYGFDYFPAWVEASRDHGARLASDIGTIDAMGSVAAFVARLGLSPNTALSFNLGIFVVLAITLFWIWRRYGAKSNAACAALCAAIPLSTPYLWHNDAGFTVLAALFLFLHGTHERHPVFWGVLFILWAGPGITILNAYTFQFSGVIPTIVDPVVLMLAFGASLWQLSQKRS